MREAEREALAERVLALAGDDACEAIVSSTQLGLTRFTQNAVHQNVASTDVTVRVRIVRDGRTGVAVTNVLDDASCRLVALNKSIGGKVEGSAAELHGLDE